MIYQEADNKKRDKKMANQPVKLIEIEECDFCDAKANFEYTAYKSSPQNYCVDCLKFIQKNEAEEIAKDEADKAEDANRDEMSSLLDEVINEIEDALIDNDIDFFKEKSKMSASTYFEVGDYKIRVSDHPSRFTYDLMNGAANFSVGVGFEDGKVSSSVNSKEDIKNMILKLMSCLK